MHSMLLIGFVIMLIGIIIYQSIKINHPDSFYFDMSDPDAVISSNIDWYIRDNISNDFEVTNINLYENEDPIVAEIKIINHKLNLEQEYEIYMDNDYKCKGHVLTK